MKSARAANNAAQQLRQRVLRGSYSINAALGSLTGQQIVYDSQLVSPQQLNSQENMLDNIQRRMNDTYRLYQTTNNPSYLLEFNSLLNTYNKNSGKLQEQYLQYQSQSEEDTLRAVNKQLADERAKKQNQLDTLQARQPNRISMDGIRNGTIAISSSGAKFVNNYGDRAKMGQLNQEISDLEWYIERNKQSIQNLAGIKQLRLEPNYEQLVEEGKKSRQNYLNQSLRPNENRVYFGMVGNQQLNEYGKRSNLLDYISKEEARDYYAFLGAGMKDAAELELERLLGNAAMQRAEELLAKGGFNTWDTTLMSFVGGVEQFTDGIKQVFTGKIDDTPSVNQIVMGELAPTLEGAQKVLSDIGYAMGYMAPALLGSTALGAAGMPLLLAQGLSSAAIGVASGANSYKDALANGYSPSAAKEYGIINGVLEGGLQFALGGISKLGGVAWQAVGKTVGVGNALNKINNVARALAGTKGMGTLLKAMQPVGRYAGRMGAEGFEEWLQAVADPIIRNNLFDENNNISPFSEEKLYQALLGAMTAGLANIGSVQSGRGVLSGSDISGNLPSQLHRAFVDGEWRFLLPRANTGDSGAVFRTLHRRADATAKEVNDYINEAIAYGEGPGPQPQEYMPIGRPSNSLINKIKGLMGKDLTGYRHVLRDNDIRHLLKSPGVTKKDIARIPDIVASPDIVFQGKNTPKHTDAPLLSNNPTIYYVKRHNGVTYYVEQVIEEGGLLAPKQMKLVPTGTVPKFVKKLPMEPAAKEQLIEQIKGLEVIPDPDVPANAVPREHALDAPGTYSSPETTIAQEPMNGNREIPRRMPVDGKLRTILPRAGESSQGVIGGSDAAGHTPEQLKTMREYQKATDSKLMEFIKKIITSPYSTQIDNLKYQLGNVTGKQAADIKQVAGVDTTGYARDITGKRVRHILKRHGEQGLADKSMADINDLGRIQYVLDNYDVIEVLGQTSNEYLDKHGNHAKMVRYGKQVDGHYYVVEAVPDTKKKTVHIVTAYQATNNQPDQQTPDAQRPWNTSQDESTGTGAPTIAQSQLNGNLEIPRRMPVGGKLGTILPRAGERVQGGNSTQQPGEARTGLSAESSSAMQPQLTHALEKRLSELGSKLGRKVVFLDGADFVRQLGEQADGLYHNGTLYINRDSGSPALTVFAHELTHSIKKGQAYDALRNYVVNSPIFQQDLARRGQTMEGMVAGKLRSYGERGVAIDRNQAEEEVLANYAATRLFTDIDAIEELANANPSMARRIIEAISNMLKAITGKDSAESRFLRQARSRYQQALKDRPSNQTSYMFASKKALLANHSLLEQAKQMLAEGYLPQQIWQQTGWMRDNKNDWKFEIDDSRVQLKDGAALWQAYLATMGRNGQRSTLKLGDMLEAQELFANYPQLAEIKIGFDSEGTRKAYWHSPSNTIYVNMDKFNKNNDMLTVILHEIQHAIQTIENFSQGGNRHVGAFISFENAAKELESEGKLVANPSEIQEQNNLSLINRRMKDILHIDSLDKIGRAGYMRLGGEVESKNTEKRQYLSAAERRNIFPSQAFNNDLSYSFSNNETKNIISALESIIKKYVPNLSIDEYFYHLSGGKNNG